MQIANFDIKIYLINPNKPIMYEITSSIYLELAERLVAAISDREFFSGAIVAYDGDICCRLVCTVVVSRERELLDGSMRRVIKRIVPVWWELKTTVGEEVVDNDFSFEELRRVIFE